MAVRLGRSFEPDSPGVVWSRQGSDQAGRELFMYHVVSVGMWETQLRASGCEVLHAASR